jgi:hypothetical protein
MGKRNFDRVNTLRYLPLDATRNDAMRTNAIVRCCELKTNRHRTNQIEGNGAESAMARSRQEAHRRNSVRHVKVVRSWH